MIYFYHQKELPLSHMAAPAQDHTYRVLVRRLSNPHHYLQYHISRIPPLQSYSHLIGILTPARSAIMQSPIKDNDVILQSAATADITVWPAVFSACFALHDSTVCRAECWLVFIGTVASGAGINCCMSLNAYTAVEPAGSDHIPKSVSLSFFR